MTASFIAQKKKISPSEIVSIRDTILALVAKWCIAKDIQSYGSQNAQKLLFTDLVNIY